MLGCGNSTLSRDLYDDGYTKISNLDYSEVVIEKMKNLHEKERPEMEWIVGDIRKLPYENESVDVCIDKGTLDSLMTSVSDVWNPEPEIVANVKGEIDEVVRVLKPDGVFLYL
jgi:SAM-dependent methyltransferase